ncbi:MAG TPA: F0F1 ATP synthase subunit B [Pseudonocardia sp.]|uniref:F0F1 ATP synthase subunit B n=1 Tax=Pseudonocardia sp. TaxID=60912 RepID=UPI002C28914D|nr:F0F1 ATP synthase subunit B [Pseudonocardia sp.]HTF47138.1 F0F1 ATP synthase subunit B [Pseudonocardia sp.]
MRTTVLAADNFLLPNGTIIAELVAFLLILFVLWKYVVPPLSKSLQQRQDMVQKQVEDAEDAARRLKAAEERYNEALTEARTEAAKIRDNARAEGERIREELRGQASAEVERIRQRGEEQLASQRDQVVRQLRGELGGLAVQLAEQLVGRELSDDEGKRSTVDRFLTQLDELPAKQSGTPASAQQPAPASGGAS